MSTTIKSFFDRQKRNLSDKSNEDNERKKVRERESSLSVSLSKYDRHFTELLAKFGEKKVNEIFELSFSTKEAQIKAVRHMEEVNESTKFINDKSEEMEADRKEKERQISELKNEVKTLNEKVETMDRSLDRDEHILEETVLLPMV